MTYPDIMVVHEINCTGIHSWESKKDPYWKTHASNDFSRRMGWLPKINGKAKILETGEMADIWGGIWHGHHYVAFKLDDLKEETITKFIEINKEQCERSRSRIIIFKRQADGTSKTDEKTEAELILENKGQEAIFKKCPHCGK